jgi:hypothetical protein
MHSINCALFWAWHFYSSVIVMVDESLLLSWEGAPSQGAGAKRNGGGQGLTRQAQAQAHRAVYHATVEGWGSSLQHYRRARLTIIVR